MTGLSLLITSGAAMAQPETVTWEPVTWQKLPRWRGFNLLEKFQQPWSGRFREDDFRMIHELGFSFVRLPMDYRCWIVDGDWEQINEDVLAEIDEALVFGEKYGIHVMMNFHRAPGYTVATPAEAKSLWTDADAQRVCRMHWQTFARRYRDVPAERLSFNLFNEPAGVDPETYIEVCRPIVEAIRAENPDRVIVSDGLGWGREVTLGLLELQVAQATRGYSPMGVSHYQASWVGGADGWPLPVWPQPLANGLLVNPTKPDMPAVAYLPLTISGDFTGARALRFKVGVVSTQAHLVVRADGREIWARDYVSGPGEGEWEEERYVERYDVYQNLWNTTHEVVLPTGAREVEIQCMAGDWIRLSELAVIAEDGTESAIGLNDGWGGQPAVLVYEDGQIRAEKYNDRQWLWQNEIMPWQAWEAAGGGVMVGEFGAHNRTPHDVVLRWLEDLLQNWQEAGWGWAMWNFRGSFGPCDSGRDDVEYEDYEGLKLDRAMLDLLQRY